MAKKSGRERKAKRKARQQAEKALPQHWQPSSEKEAKQNLALIKESLRWNTDLRLTDLPNEPIQNRSLKTIALQTLRRNLLSPDPKVANAALNVLATLEGQNQKDQLSPKEEESKQPTQQNNFFIALQRASDQDILDLKSIIEANG